MILIKIVGIRMNINLEEAYLDSEFLYTKYKISDIGNVRWGDNICLYNSIWEKFKPDEYPILKDKDSDKPTNISFFMNDSNVTFESDKEHYYLYSTVNYPNNSNLVSQHHHCL